MFEHPDDRLRLADKGWYLYEDYWDGYDDRYNAAAKPHTARVTADGTLSSAALIRRRGGDKQSVQLPPKSPLHINLATTAVPPIGARANCLPNRFTRHR